jgi:hypothetical protein
LKTPIHIYLKFLEDVIYNYKEIHVWVGENLYEFSDVENLLRFLNILKSEDEIIVGFEYRTQLASMSKEDTIEFFSEE